MDRRLLLLAIAAGLLRCDPAVAQHFGLVPAPDPAQIPPPAPKAARVQITAGPALELARDDWAIIRWVTNNPGGSDGHVGIVRYGSDPGDLSRTARNPIVLNRAQPLTTFRVIVDGLKPGTVYYYTVTSTESDGTGDGVESSVGRFTMPGPR